MTPDEIDRFLRYVHSRPITISGQEGTLYIAPFRVVPEEPSDMMRDLKEALELTPQELAEQRARLDRILDDARERRETYQTEGYYPEYPLPGWWPTHGTTVLFNPGGVRTTRYRYRGKNIPTPWEQDVLALREPTLPLERLEGLIAR